MVNLSRNAILMAAALGDHVIARLQASHAGNSTCSSLELIIARGTNEPVAPTYGIVVGDPLYNATKNLIPDVTGYAVEYPASFDPESRFIGSNDTVKHLKMQSEKCAAQKYALVGYSQGAEVMHIAAQGIDPSLYSRVIAVVMFGDPGNKFRPISPFKSNITAFPAPLAEKLKQNCHKGDIVCTNEGTSIDEHIKYGRKNETYMTDSATYIYKQLETRGKAGSSPSPNGGLTNADQDNLSAFLALQPILNPTPKPGQLGAQPKSPAPALTTVTPVSPKSPIRREGWTKT